MECLKENCGGTVVEKHCVSIFRVEDVARYECLDCGSSWTMDEKGLKFKNIKLSETDNAWWCRDDELSSSKHRRVREICASHLIGGSSQEREVEIMREERLLSKPVNRFYRCKGNCEFLGLESCRCR
jgi:hypothetical protein